MPATSAGLLMYRIANDELNIFLVHPGGPFFRNKDEGAWTIPKGLPENEELLIETAKREFFEETGIYADETLVELGHIKQKGGKVVYAWAFEGTWEESAGIKCNNFSMEWPPKSGNISSFPEADKAAWFVPDIAVKKINPAQIPFIERLIKILS